MLSFNFFLRIKYGFLIGFGTYITKYILHGIVTLPHHHPPALPVSFILRPIDKKPKTGFEGRFRLCITLKLCVNLFFRGCYFCHHILAVHAGDVRHGYFLGAFGFAGVGIGAIAKTQFVHFRYHVPYPFGCFYFSLRQQGKL